MRRRSLFLHTKQSMDAGLLVHRIYREIDLSPKFNKVSPLCASEGGGCEFTQKMDVTGVLPSCSLIA